MTVHLPVATGIDIESPAAEASSEGPTSPLSLSTMLPDLFRANPHTRRIFDRYGLTGCGGRLGPAESIAFFAKSHGVDADQLLDEITTAIASPPSGPVAEAAPSIADTIYRRFFLCAIAVILTAGATWGAFLLWRIGFAGQFTGVSLHEVNAHGHAQIYGWVGLFIMGFAYQAFPRMWHTRLFAPPLAIAAFTMTIIGLVLRSLAMPFPSLTPATIALIGGALESLAILLFATQILLTFRASQAKFEPYVAFVILALVFYFAMSLLDLWHTWTTMTAATRDQLLWHVATYQAPLRDLQIHGLALFMILGVSIRMLPALFDLPQVPPRRAWQSLTLLTLAVLAECALFIAYRWSNNHLIAAFLLLPWVMLLIGCALIATPMRLWPLPFNPKSAIQNPKSPDRSFKFVKAAYLWLLLSLLMLLLLPVYQSLTKIPFSHAYYGAIRHAITVGFVSMMILGMAAKVVPTLNGVDPRKLSPLWGPFILVNLGCFLRVSTQTLTDFSSHFFPIIGLSGLLEVTGLGWWGLGLVAIMRRGKREQSEDSATETSGTPAPPLDHPRPHRRRRHPLVPRHAGCFRPLRLHPPEESVSPQHHGPHRDDLPSRRSKRSTRPPS